MLRKLHHRLASLGRSIFGDLYNILGAVLLVGILGGLAGMLYLKLLWSLESFLGPEKWAPFLRIGVLAATGVLVAGLTRYAGNPGNVELLVDNIHVFGGSRGLRELRSLIPISLLCIASGGAAGPEAPLVQTTGTLGTWLADRKRVPIHTKRILTITGMAAGFTVLFGAPLGAAIFALEILHRRSLEYYEALFPAVLGALCGYALFILATGLGLSPVWHFPELPPLQPSDLGWAVIAGLTAVPVTMAFTYLNVSLRRLFDRFPVSLRPVIGGVALGLLALWSPYALTYGEAQINPLIISHPILSALVLAAVAKLIGTSLTVASGWRGGFIIPLFFIGAALGRAWHVILPYTSEAVWMATMMAALNTGVTKTPLGSTLVVTEMCGLRLLPTTLIACVITLLLTSEVSLIESQRARDTAAKEAVVPHEAGSAS